MMKIVLASGSSRRRELLAGLGIPFEVRLQDDVDESVPPSVEADRVAEYACRKKSATYDIADDELLITADTVVVIDGGVLGKPADADDAYRMLRRLSGRTHHVITACMLRTNDRERCFSVTTDVTFKTLQDSEIRYYVSHYRPFDKAGAYGIQEWIGLVGVTAISGSYFNVMGLPVQRIYEALQDMGAL